MSDAGIVKSTRSTPASTRKTRKGSAKKDNFDLTTETPNAQTDLVDVAIAAADAPFTEATKVFNTRYAENLGKFVTHVEATQQQVASGLIDRIYKHFNTSEDDIYGAD